MLIHSSYQLNSIQGNLESQQSSCGPYRECKVVGIAKRLKMVKNHYIDLRRQPVHKPNFELEFKYLGGNTKEQMISKDKGQGDSTVCLVCAEPGFDPWDHCLVP